LVGSTRRRKVASVRSFFLFLHDQELIAANPAQKLIPPAREYHQPRVLSQREYQRLQLAVAHQIRDGAVIELLLQTGMRLSELTRLTLTQLDLPAKVTKEPDNVGSVRIFGKGRKDRTVTLNWRICRALKSYLAVRRPVDDPRLSISKFGAGMSPRAIELCSGKPRLRSGCALVHVM
jgi:site-specific recombinase XerD